MIVPHVNDLVKFANLREPCTYGLHKLSASFKTDLPVGIFNVMARQDVSRLLPVDCFLVVPAYHSFSHSRRLPGF